MNSNKTQRVLTANFPWSDGAFPISAICAN
uniref:Uncharacterized protein n=1 Tax=Rhizophora mucronata TaxID=61149 RepID=A0A2P2QB04_RHIMU